MAARRAAQCFSTRRSWGIFPSGPPPASRDPEALYPQTFLLCPCLVRARILMFFLRGLMRGRASFSGSFVAALAILGCHTITELPSNPTASPTPGVVTPIQIPITNVPTPPPTPTPAPTATPPPTSTPTPTPSATPPPGGQIHVL